MSIEDRRMSLEDIGTFPWVYLNKLADSRARGVGSIGNRYGS